MVKFVDLGVLYFSLVLPRQSRWTAGGPEWILRPLGGLCRQHTKPQPPNTQGKAGRTRKPQPAKRSNWERAESQQGLHCGEANPNCYSRGKSSTCERGNPYGPQFSKVAPCLLTEIQTDKKQIVMMDSVSHIKPPSDRFWPRLRQILIS